MEYDKSEVRCFPYNANPFNLLDLNEFVKRRIGHYCYVSSVPKSFEEKIGIGIVKEKVTFDETKGIDIIVFQGYDDIFHGEYKQGNNGLYIIFPKSEEVRKLFNQRINEEKQ